MTHAHLDPESLLELALAPERERRRASAASCVTCLVALQRIEREVAGLRARLDVRVEARRAGALATRVLDATTRASRGGARTRRRWIAAAAAVLLAALAFGAWWRTQRQERLADPLADGASPARASDGGQRRGADPAIANALVRDREVLDRALRSPVFEGLAAVRRLGELLACRVERWRGESCGARAPGPQASGVEAVLWADILLDDYVRNRRPGGELAYLLSTCRRLAETDAPEAHLAELTVARAARYGILAEPERTAASRAPSPRDASPLENAWFEALSTAVASSAARDDPSVRAWLAYGGPSGSAR